MKIDILETDKGEVNAFKVVSEAEWIVARKDLLTREKELTRLRDEVSRHRRELPWVKVKKEYVFNGPNGQETLTDLFDSRSQLIVYHFMSRRQFTSYRSRAIPSITHPAADCVCIAAGRVGTNGKR